MLSKLDTQRPIPLSLPRGEGKFNLKEGLAPLLNTLVQGVRKYFFAILFYYF
jgi:hypothetical protein